jgi:hypothetical protein
MRRVISQAAMLFGSSAGYIEVRHLQTQFQPAKDNAMPGSPQATELTLPLKRTNAQVIEFQTPPTYRECAVDISKSSKVEFYGVVTYKGQRRAWVENVTQSTGRCRIILNGCMYTIHRSYKGADVSSGVKEI